MFSIAVDRLVADPSSVPIAVELNSVNTGSTFTPAACAASTSVVSGHPWSAPRVPSEFISIEKSATCVSSSQLNCEVSLTQ